MSEKNEDLVSAIVDLREADVARMVDELLASGTDPLDVVAAGKQAMDVVGKQFADGELFIPELIMAGEIMKAISTKVEPRLAGQRSAKRLGTVVLGTVQGDIHDIGKGIVATMLDIAAFDVIDLGVGQGRRSRAGDNRAKRLVQGGVFHRGHRTVQGRLDQRAQQGPAPARHQGGPRLVGDRRGTWPLVQGVETVG